MINTSGTALRTYLTKHVVICSLQAVRVQVCVCSSCVSRVPPTRSTVRVLGFLSLGFAHFSLYTLVQNTHDTHPYL